MGNPRVEQVETSFVLFDGARFDHVRAEWFRESYWLERGAVVGEALGRGSVWFVRQEQEFWALRHYHRGGFMTRFSEQHYLWMGLERTRAFREWRLLQALYERGMPVPRPIAACVNRRGPLYRADIITVCLKDTRSWAARIGTGDVSAEHWPLIGRTLRRFHDEGVDHPDLNARNILIDDSQGIFLVDFDKGGFRSSGAWKKANLRRLERSLRKIALETATTFDGEAWRQLEAGYRGDL